MREHTTAACHDCGRAYGEAYGFPDLLVPHDIWNRHLSPTGDEGGLLCPSCMCKRAHAAGLADVPARFTSGPFAAQPATTTDALRTALADAEADKAAAFEILLTLTHGGGHFNLRSVPRQFMDKVREALGVLSPRDSTTPAPAAGETREGAG
jgi:hypothetical protein